MVKDDDNAPATKGDLKKCATKSDLKRFATKEDLKKYATKQDLLEMEKRILHNAYLLHEQFTANILDAFKDQNSLTKDRFDNHESRITYIEGAVGIATA